MSLKKKKESLTNLLRGSDKKLKYFITTDQTRGKRFAVAEFIEPATVNVKSTFMSYKEMRCYLFGVIAVYHNTLKLENDTLKLEK